jgi:plasmid maintenance system antidote protein VapI
MKGNEVEMELERYAKEYENDPEFIAEGLSIKVVEEMLKYMDKQKLNQSWMAQKMGVSRAHISKILNAPSNMTLLTIAKIAVALSSKPDICLNAESSNSISNVEVPTTKEDRIYLNTPVITAGYIPMDAYNFKINRGALAYATN